MKKLYLILLLTIVLIFIGCSDQEPQYTLVEYTIECSGGDADIVYLDESEVLQLDTIYGSHTITFIAHRPYQRCSIQASNLQANGYVKVLIKADGFLIAHAYSPTPYGIASTGAQVNKD